MTVEELSKNIDRINKRIKELNTESSKRQGRKEQLANQLDTSLKDYTKKYGVKIDIKNTKQIEEEFNRVATAKAEEVAKMEQAIDFADKGKFIELRLLLGEDVVEEKEVTEKSQKLNYREPNNSFVIPDTSNNVSSIVENDEEDESEELETQQNTEIQEEDEEYEQEKNLSNVDDNEDDEEDEEDITQTKQEHIVNVSAGGTNTKPNIGIKIGNTSTAPSKPTISVGIASKPKIGIKAPVGISNVSKSLNNGVSPESVIDSSEFDKIPDFTSKLKGTAFQP